jgi:hypothetical protein
MDAIQYRRLTLALTALLIAVSSQAQVAMNLQTTHYTCMLANKPAYIILTNNGDSLTGTLSIGGMMNTLGGKLYGDHLIFYEYGDAEIISKFEGKVVDKTLKMTRRIMSEPNKPHSVVMKQSGSQIRQLLRRSSPILKGDDKRNIQFTSVPILTQLKDLDRSDRVNALLESLVDGMQYSIPYLVDKVLALRTESNDGTTTLRMINLRKAEVLTIGDCLTGSGIRAVNSWIHESANQCDTVYSIMPAHSDHLITSSGASVQLRECTNTFKIHSLPLKQIRPYLRAVVSGLAKY